jgi:hypothetical protein
MVWGSRFIVQDTQVHRSGYIMIYKTGVGFLFGGGGGGAFYVGFPYDF